MKLFGASNTLLADRLCNFAALLSGSVTSAVEDALDPC